MTAVSAMQYLTEEQKSELFLSFTNGDLWTRESTTAFIKEKYGVTFQKGGLSKFLKSQNLTLENYYFPKICKSSEIKDWFLSGKLEKIKNTVPRKYELFWVGTKAVKGKFNMIFLVNMQGKMYWSVINGIITKKRQLNFMKQARIHLNPIKPILLRTKTGCFQFDCEYRYPAVYRVRPSPSEICRSAATACCSP
jgi:hypothetical protein